MLNPNNMNEKMWELAGRFLCEARKDLHRSQKMKRDAPGDLRDILLYKQYLEKKHCADMMLIYLRAEVR